MHLPFKTVEIWKYELVEFTSQYTNVMLPKEIVKFRFQK